MNENVYKPPPVIHSARTLFYAVNDDSVEFTGRINLFVGDNLEKLGEMPLLAICENYCVPGDILLFFCNKDWEPQGTIGLDSVAAAKEKAEVGYKGINKKWVNAESSKEELYKYLRDVYEVDPDTEWWKVECAFCGKDDSEVDRMLGSTNEKTYICNNCIRALYEIINEENDA